MSKQKRWCPAIAQQISSAECGQNRASRYDCPAECHFNPWSPANYERALEIDGGLEAKMFSALKAETRGDAEFQSDLRRIEGASLVRREQFFVETFYLERDAAGKTFAERLLKNGSDRFSNDEKVLLGRMTQMRPALIEIHRVINETQCETVDLIAPERKPFLLQDRALAARAVRFRQLLGWIFPMPHYCRMHGAAFSLPEVDSLEPEEVLRELVAHLGGPIGPTEALREWLARHTVDLDEAARQVAAARQRRMWEGMDAKICQSIYAIRGSRETLLRQLTRAGDCAPVEWEEGEETAGQQTAWYCFDEMARLEPGQSGLSLERSEDISLGRSLLGRMILSEDQLRLETNASARLQALKKRVEKRAGRLLEFVSERVDDLVRKHAALVPPADLSLVPPALLQNPPRISLSETRSEEKLPPGLSLEEAGAELRRRYQRQWIDLAVPALGGKTPREAARDPALRPALLRLIKPIIRRHDERVLETGQEEDINWLTTELQLVEVAFPAPPPREPVGPADEENFFDPDDEIFFDPPPPLPSRPLREKEIGERMNAFDQKFSTAAETFEALMEVAPDLFEAVEEITVEISERSGLYLLTILARAWFVFFPAGTAPDRFDAEAVVAGAAAETDEFLKIAQISPKRLAAFLGTGPQPILTMMLTGPLLEMGMPPRKRRGEFEDFQVSVEEMPILIGALRAFINEAHRAAGGGDRGLA
ncbi:hypothetical protein BH20VER3_BH20VER3_07740 [soil metagenome]